MPLPKVSEIEASNPFTEKLNLTAASRFYERFTHYSVWRWSALMDTLPCFNRVAMELVEALGRVVRARREELGWSQEKLAEMAGVHTNFVGFAERGQQTMSVTSLQKIASAINALPSELLAAAEQLAAGSA